MTRSIRSLFIAIMLVGGFQSLGMALSADPQKSTQLQFNFITPGARATALGGAFIGLADDATAVESNPAGLTQLLALEVSAEFKYFRFITEHGEHGRSHEGEARYAEFYNSVASVPFVSYVYPYKRFVFSIYRQESVKSKDSYQIVTRWIVRIPGESGYFYTGNETDNSVELTVTNYGIGAAIQIVDGFSLAVSPRWSWMTAKLRSIYDGVHVGDYKETIDDDDSGFSLNAGLLWSPHPKVSIGAVYKVGAEFAAKSTLVRIREPNPEYSDYEPDFTDEFTLKVPDSFGIGVAFRATDFLTFTLDTVHIQYKDLLKDFDVPEYIGYLGHTGKYIVNNATETHFGVEYLLPLGKQFLALRAGIYNDPAHNIRRYSDSYEFVSYSRRGDDQIHLTGGLGLVLGDRFQIDTAVDIADKRKQFSFSSVYRFGRRKPKIRDRKLAKTRASVPIAVEETRPSLTFTVVMSEGAQGKKLEIQNIRADARDINDFKVTAMQVEVTEFLIKATLKRERKKFKADIRIEIEQDTMRIKKVDAEGQVTVITEKPDALEVKLTFR